MVLEATMICLDNSEWMRNGDFIPTRMEAQHDAVNLICGAKTQSNAENTVGIMTMAGKVEVLVSLTSDLGKILTSLHGIKIGADCDVLGAMQVAQLALKNRQNKNQHQRLIMFIGSPVKADKNSLIRMGRRLKKNNVAVDIVNFGEDAENAEKLESFVSAVNNSDNSHLVNIPPGPHILSDALVASPIIMGEGGAGGAGMDGFGVDANLDPELAEALRISYEEERARREAEQRRAAGESGTAPAQPPATADVDMTDVADDEMAQAIALSMMQTPDANTSTQPSQPAPATRSLDELSEEEQMALALSMSLQSQVEEKPTSSDATQPQPAGGNIDPNLVSSLLSGLPGVNANDELIRNIMDTLKKDDQDQEKKDDQDKEKK